MQIKRKNCEITVVKISQILIVALTRRQKGAEPATDVVTIMRRCAVHVILCDQEVFSPRNS